jgi:hypothetical protein
MNRRTREFDAELGRKVKFVIAETRDLSQEAVLCSVSTSRTHLGSRMTYSRT